MADIFDEIIARLSNYSAGLVERVEGAGSSVLGSGVFVSIGGRRGILTAGHVAATYETIADVGLVRFTKGANQRRYLNLADAQNLIFASSDEWTETDADLAFTLLGPDTASSVEARNVFLNMEKNGEKIEATPPSDAKCIDVIFGLVAAYSATPVIENGEFVSDMRAVAYRGNILSKENGLYVFQPAEKNFQNLPDSFGGTSGAGLWRIWYVEKEDSAEIVSFMLAGIASWEDKTTKRIACQGYERIYQGVIPAVQREFPQ